MKKHKISMFIFLAIGAVVLALVSRGKEIDHVTVNDQYLTKAIRTDYPGFVGQERELSASTSRLMKEYNSGDERQRIAGHEQWGQERAGADLTKEREWNRIGTTPCANFGSGLKPQLCIEHIGAKTVPINTPGIYRVRWRNLPMGAYIRVWSRNAAPVGQS